MSEITELLNASNECGDSSARLIELVYAELRQMARAKMANERNEITLQPTALVHEAWLKLTSDGKIASFSSRAHFFAAAAESMRRILIDHARARLAHKRGAGAPREELNEFTICVASSDEALLEINDALDRLTVAHPKKAELVKLRYFVGLSYEEAAETLDISVSTAKQWWAFSRAWLSVQMRDHLA